MSERRWLGHAWSEPLGYGGYSCNHSAELAALREVAEKAEELLTVLNRHDEEAGICEPYCGEYENLWAALERLDKLKANDHG